jgi:chromosome segregation ATPase
MTNEEREQLCDKLRHLPAYLSEDGMRAADEIERLAATIFELKVTEDKRIADQDAEIERLTNDLRLANDAFDRSTKEIERAAKEVADATSLLQHGLIGIRHP